MAKKSRRSAKYWADRLDEIMAYVDQTDMDFFDELQDVYTESRQNVQKEIYAFYAQYAKDNKISLQEAKKRLMREDLSDYRANAEKYFKQAEKDPELLKRLNEQYRAATVTRLEALQLSLEYETGRMNGKLQESFDRYLKDTAQYAYRKISNGNSQSTLNKPALDQLVKTPFKGKNYSESIWGNTDALARDLKKALTQGFVRGSGPADMARELRKKYNVAKSRAEAIIRTDGTAVVNNATLKRYQEFGLTKYQFLAHIDDRTTEICKEQNKKVYDIADYKPGTNAPPMHVNCRSTIVPDDKELGFEDTPEEKAAELIQAGEKNESKITKDLGDVIGQSDMKLEGLKYKIKSLDSLTRKVTGEPNANMRDVVRYTAISSADDLAKNYSTALELMHKKGYTESAVKNYWTNTSNPYNGINTNFISPKGYEFELQFHTKESFELKNGKLHELYEKARVLDKKSSEVAELNKEMMLLSKRLTSPKDIDSIKTRK